MPPLTEATIIWQTEAPEDIATDPMQEGPSVQMPLPETGTIEPVEPHGLPLITAEAQEPTVVHMEQRHRPGAVVATIEAVHLLQGPIEVLDRAQGAINQGAPRQVEPTALLPDRARPEVIAVADLREAVDPVA